MNRQKTDLQWKKHTSAVEEWYNIQIYVSCFFKIAGKPTAFIVNMHRNNTTTEVVREFQETSNTLHSNTL